MAGRRVASTDIMCHTPRICSRGRATLRCLPKQPFSQDGEKERAVARPLASFSWVAHHRLPCFLSRRDSARQARPDADFSFQPQTVPRQGNACVKRHEHYDVEGPQLERYRTRRVGRPAASRSPGRRGADIDAREARGDLVDVSGQVSWRSGFSCLVGKRRGKRRPYRAGRARDAVIPSAPAGCHGGDNDRGRARSPFCRRRRQPIVAAHIQRCSHRGYRTRVKGRIAGWGLVRTHAAGAARVLPRPAPPRPLGASLLAPGAPPDAGLLGAIASRIPATEGGRAVP